MCLLCLTAIFSRVLGVSIIFVYPNVRIILLQPRQDKKKLWGDIEQVVKKKISKFGRIKLLLKLVGVETELWVFAKDVSKNVVSAFEADEKLPKNSRAFVDRGYVLQQRKFLDKSESASPTQVHQKLKLRYKWVGIAQVCMF